MIAELRRLRLGGTASDVLLVALLLAIAEAEAVSTSYDVPRGLVMLGSGLAALPLLARRRAPILAGTLSLGIALATVALVIDRDGGQLSMVLTVLAAAYSVGAHGERWSVAWVAAAVLTMLVGMAVAEPSDLIFPALFFAFLPWLGGRLLRSHRALTRELARETVRAGGAGGQLRDRAIARERARISASCTTCWRTTSRRSWSRRGPPGASSSAIRTRRARRPGAASRTPAARRSPSCATSSGAVQAATRSDPLDGPADARAGSATSCAAAREAGLGRRR